MNRKNILGLTLGGMFAAMAFICFSYLRIEIPMGLGLTGKIYLGHTFIILAALILGVKYGALSSALGLTIGDLLTGYTTSAPPTFLSKFLIGFIIAFIAHKLFHLSEETDDAKITKIVLIASIVGSVAGVVLEPLIRFAFKFYILGQAYPIAYASAVNCAISMSLGDLASIPLAFILYKILRKSPLTKLQFNS